MAASKKVNEQPTIEAVIDLIAALRDENGCPWDRKQTPDTLTVYLIEETYELVEAIAANDTAAIQEELGDVLFQILFLVYLYQQEGRFQFSDVLAQNIGKMIRRHPHVFGTDKVDSAGQVKKRWREIKKEEKKATGSLMDSVPPGMPALMRAYRISERAVGAGFEWGNLNEVLAQAESEWTEFKHELGRESRAIENSNAALEFGDVLFTLINVARWANIHPETALTRSTQKFIQRFKKMESMAARQDRTLETVPRDEMEALWEAVKEDE